MVFGYTFIAPSRFELKILSCRLGPKIPPVGPVILNTGFEPLKINQPGFPLLTIKILSWEEDTLKLLIEQQKFGEKFEEETMWKIPVMYKSSARLV